MTKHELDEWLGEAIFNPDTPSIDWRTIVGLWVLAITLWVVLYLLG
jgi:hypothetical protein